MTEHRTAIRCARITKSFGSGEAVVHALRGIDLEVRRGEMMALVGPSGCGKTSLISIMAGLLQRDEGVRDDDRGKSLDRARSHRAGCAGCAALRHERGAVEAGSTQRHEEVAGPDGTRISGDRGERPVLAHQRAAAMTGERRQSAAHRSTPEKAARSSC